MPGGFRIKAGQLLRAAHLADAATSDIAFLEGLSIGTLVDFRKDEEKKGKWDKMIPGARYVCIPIDVGGAISATATEAEKKKYLGKKKFDVRKVIVMAAFNEKAKVAARSMYSTILNYPDCQDQLAAFLRLVVEAGEQPILFHCTQGKDRTGMAAALLLAALGADRETIIADYDVTNQVYEKDVRKYSRRVKLLGGKEEELAVVKAIMGASTESFAQALDAIDRRFGSLEAYLKGPMRLSESDLQTLRSRYLEPIPAKSTQET